MGGVYDRRNRRRLLTTARATRNLPRQPVPSPGNTPWPQHTSQPEHSLGHFRMTEDGGVTNLNPMPYSPPPEYSSAVPPPFHHPITLTTSQGRGRALGWLIRADRFQEVVATRVRTTTSPTRMRQITATAPNLSLPPIATITTAVTIREEMLMKIQTTNF